MDDRRRYVEGLATVLKPGGRIFLLCFSDEESGTHRNAFAEGWVIESIEPSRLEVRADLKKMDLLRGRAEGVVVRRCGERSDRWTRRL